MEWALSKIGWDSAFGTIAPAGSATVALLDTGVDATHPDLTGNIIPGTSFIDGKDGLIDPNGHGTWMAGIIAALTDNGTGIAGVGYAGVRVMPVTVLNATGIGQDSDIIAGIVWAADNGADVILMAFSNPDYSRHLQEAIDYAWSKGAVLVAATGNGGVNTPTFPAGDRGVIGVSATDENDLLTIGSNYGQDTFLAAPGNNIFTTALGHAYTYISGTSASAAFVAGTAAFMKAVDPELTNGIIVGRLARSADQAASQAATGNGRVNMANALADTGTDALQPAGAAPVGTGGPFVGPYTAAGNTSITGKVTASGASPIPGATVTCTAGCSDPITPVMTDASGNYSFRFTFSGSSKYSVTLEVSAPGYVTSSRPAVTSSPQNFQLAPKENQTITFTPPVKSYGDASFDLSNYATGGASGSPVTFTIVRGPGSLGGSTLTITGAGDIVIKVSQVGNANYNAAPDVTQTLPVGKTQLTIIADAKRKTYGAADELTYAATGFVNGETSTVLTGNLSRVAGENVGSYAINQGSLAGANYTIAYTGANLTITPAVLTVTAANGNRTYGQPNPSFVANWAGFIGSDTLANSVAGFPSLTTTADTSSDAGSYPITAALGTLSSSNYSFSFAAGTLTVGKADQTISFPAPGNKVFGAAPFAVTATASSSLPVMYAIESGPATISGNLIKITGAGIVAVKVSQAGNSNVKQAELTRSFTVNCDAPDYIIVPSTSTTGSFLPGWGTSKTPGATYVLEYSLASGEYRELSTGTNTYAVAASLPSGTYKFRVKATKEGYDSTYTESATVNVTLVCGAPDYIIVPSSSTTGTFLPSWGASNIAGVTYVVEYSKDGNDYASFSSGANTYAVATSLPKGTYLFRVKAKKTGYDDSTYTYSAGVTVNPACGAPNYITIPSSGAASSFMVGWGASNISGVTYVLQYSKDNGEYLPFSSGTNTYAIVTGLASGSYQFRVQATKFGYEASSFTTSIAFNVLQTLDAPSYIDVPSSTSTGTFLVRWGGSKIAGSTYVLESSPNNTDWVPAYTGTNTYTTVTGLASGTYMFRMKAKKEGYADSGYTTSTNVTVNLTCGTPDSINVPASSTTGTFLVRWAGSNIGGASYVLEYSNGGGWTPAYSGTNLYSTVSGLNSGTYTFRVKDTQGWL